MKLSSNYVKLTWRCSRRLLRLLIASQMLQHSYFTFIVIFNRQNGLPQQARAANHWKSKWIQYTLEVLLQYNMEGNMESNESGWRFSIYIAIIAEGWKANTKINKSFLYSIVRSCANNGSKFRDYIHAWRAYIPFPRDMCINYGKSNGNFKLFRFQLFYERQ